MASTHSIIRSLVGRWRTLPEVAKSVVMASPSCNLKAPVPWSPTMLKRISLLSHLEDADYNNGLGVDSPPDPLAFIVMVF